MITIKNINPAYGDEQTFSGATVEQAEAAMVAAIRACGPEYQIDTVSEGADYEIDPRHPAAVSLGKLGGTKTSPAKTAAVRANGKKGGRPRGYTDLTLHRDGTVTYWSVYRQQWVRKTATVSDAEFAAMPAANREAILKHLGK